MILTKDLLAEELLTTFKVIKVRHEPYAESEWTLQFEDHPPITYFDKCFDTTDEDEQLVGKTIKAQIDLETVTDDQITLITDPVEQKKSMIYVPTGSVIVTGVYFDDVKEVEPKYGETEIDSSIDSLFKVHVLDNLGGSRFNFKKGDWIKIKTSECCIIISRKNTPLLLEL